MNLHPHDDEKAVKRSPFLSHGLNLNDAFLTEALHTISIQGLKKLAAHYSPELLYPKIKNITEDEYDAALNELLQLSPVEGLFDAIAWVKKIFDGEGIEMLQEYGVNIENGEEGGSYLVRCLLEHREKFDFVAETLISSNCHIKKSFTLFRPQERTNDLTVSSPPQRETLFQSKIIAYLKSNGYGNFLQTTPF